MDDCGSRNDRKVQLASCDSIMQLERQQCSRRTPSTMTACRSSGPQSHYVPPRSCEVIRWPCFAQPREDQQPIFIYLIPHLKIYPPFLLPGFTYLVPRSHLFPVPPNIHGPPPTPLRRPAAPQCAATSPPFSGRPAQLLTGT